MSRKSQPDSLASDLLPGARHYRWIVAALGVGALLFSAVGWVVGQTPPEPYTFFKQDVGLNDDQVASLERGKAVTQVLPTSTPAEVAVFGAIYIAASPENYLSVAQNLDNLRRLPNYLGIRQFSTPPKLSDLEGFVLDDDDIRDLKSCKPGKCQLQLPKGSIEKLQASVNWSAPDVTRQVNGLAQKMALDELVQYQKDGNAALGSYYDKEQPVRVVERFESLLHESSSLSHYLPDLERYLLEYPRVPLRGAESIFYWERVKFGLKPTVRMNQMVIYRGSGPSGPIDSVAIKQLYASHYFQTALDLSVCATDSRQPGQKGFYLITVKGSRQEGLTGPKGSVIRKTAISKSRSSLENLLVDTKRLLESRH